MSTNIKALTDKIAEAITEHEEEVFPYVGNGNHVLDQNGLKKVIRKVLQSL